MKIGKFVAGAGLALTLATFSPAAFAQNSAYNGGNYNRNGQNYSNNGNGNGHWVTGDDLRHESRLIRNRINMKRGNGEKVSSANHQYRLGLRDLENGKTILARRHFARAENALGMRSNNEVGMRLNNENGGTASSTVPSSGNWNNNSRTYGNGNR